MLAPLALSLILASYVSANGEFIVLHAPRSLSFKGHDQVKGSILKEIYSTALGFSTEQYSNWDGLFIEDPFNLAEAVVTVAVDGVSDIGSGKGHHFPLKTNEIESDVYDALERRVTQRHPEQQSGLFRVDLGDGVEGLQEYGLFKNVKNGKGQKTYQNQLQMAVDEDRAFLNDVVLLNNIIDEIEKSSITPDNTPDIYWFKISSLHPLRDLYGENSTQVKEAKQLLNDAISRLNSAFNKLYNGRVLISVICSDAVHTRRTRSILAAAEDNQPKNLAQDYDPDYPVIFNIILWFGVAMFFSLLAICIAIGSMDPGRDSIIYRMTSTRLKKDN